MGIDQGHHSDLDKEIGADNDDDGYLSIFDELQHNFAEIMSDIYPAAIGDLQNIDEGNIDIELKVSRLHVSQDVVPIVISSPGHGKNYFF